MRDTMRTSKKLGWAVALLVAAGCSGGDDDGGSDDLPEVYEFESAFVDGESSVRYTGQTFRQVLIEEMKARIGGLTARIDGNTFSPAPGDVVEEMLFYWEYDGTGGSVPLTITTTPATLQSTYAELSSSGANLKAKIAGNDDPEIQHVAWTTTGSVVGIATIGTSTGLQFTPESLVMAWFDQLDARAVDWTNGVTGVDPVDGAALTKVHVTPEGVDLQQLIQKFLSGAIALSQATDDYLDDASPGKGLLSPNTRDGENPYTTLEHAWDEGFGYFGAARDYRMHTDEALTEAPYVDSNEDGAIDLLTEYSFGHSINASKRDAGSATGTDLSGAAIEAFLAGRLLIAKAAKDERALTTSEMAELVSHRDAAIAAWERAIAATIIHYINEVIAHGDLLASSSSDYDFYAHAKEWSEMKGFALALQFNPHSPVTDANFATLHGHLGDQPVFETADLAGYETDLLAARSILATAYGFETADVEAW